MSPLCDDGPRGNKENIPPTVGRYNTVTRQKKRPYQQTRIPWHRRKLTQKTATPKPSNLVKKPISPKVIIRKAKKAAINQAANNAINTLWELAKGLAANPEFNHTATWWYRYILQMARKGQTKRRVNLWNVFLHKEVMRLNDGKHL